MISLGIFCANVPLRNYSLAQSITFPIVHPRLTPIGVALSALWRLAL